MVAIFLLKVQQLALCEQLESCAKKRLSGVLRTPGTPLDLPDSVKKMWHFPFREGIGDVCLRRYGWFRETAYSVILHFKRGTFHGSFQ